MKVLGRDLLPPFDGFWGQLAGEIDVPASMIEEGRQAVFGTESYGGDPDDLSSSRLPRWMDLPDAALGCHVAHELAHLVLRGRGFPVSVRGRQYPEDSPEARVGGDLEEMINHYGVEELLSPFPFDRSHIHQYLFEGARNGLEMSPVPERGTLWWCTWACRFCELKQLLPERTWLRLEVVYEGRCPEIADKGRELVEIMQREGFQDPGQALQAMIKARDALGLRQGERCLVLDPRDGEVY